MRIIISAKDIPNKYPAMILGMRLYAAVFFLRLAVFSPVNKMFFKLFVFLHKPLLLKQLISSLPFSEDNHNLTDTNNLCMTAEI